MVYVCLVKGCINSYKYTTKKCKLFKFPEDEFTSKQWLINCSREDLIGKSLTYFKICSDHFLECMYKNIEKKVLLPHAVPTDFTMIPKEDSCNPTTCLDTSISDPICNASVSTSTQVLCVNYAKQQQQLDQSFLFIYYKAYVTADHSNFGKLNVPPNEFFNFINQLDDVFIVNFPLLAVEPNVGSKLKNLFDNIPFDHPCKNFDIEFLKKLYIRLRIFHSINRLNKDMLTSGRKHRKLDILSHL